VRGHVPRNLVDDLHGVIAEAGGVLAHDFLARRRVDAERLGRAVLVQDDVTVLPHDLGEAVMCDRLRACGDGRHGVGVDGVGALDQVARHARIVQRFATGDGAECPDSPAPAAYLARYADSSSSSSRSTSPAPLVTRVGFKPFAIVSFVITHFVTSVRDGSSNMTSRRACSMIERSPRAPVSRASAWSEISQSASSMKTSSMSS